jgi:hypothetical protein
MCKTAVQSYHDVFLKSRTKVTPIPDYLWTPSTPGCGRYKIGRLISVGQWQLYFLGIKKHIVKLSLGVALNLLFSLLSSAHIKRRSCRDTTEKKNSQDSSPTLAYKKNFTFNVFLSNFPSEKGGRNMTYNVRVRVNFFVMYMYMYGHILVHVHVHIHGHVHVNFPARIQFMFMFVFNFMFMFMSMSCHVPVFLAQFCVVILSGIPRN